jgi:uncharacterized Fe-S cluster protein YjdI
MASRMPLLEHGGPVLAIHIGEVRWVCAHSDICLRGVTTSHIRLLRLPTFNPPGRPLTRTAISPSGATFAPWT